ncbi:MAG: hypothetical protein PHS73_01885 [Candidatus Peribacteraceae bacterium]|nr:hypothetical protein [Candidatus Peribacteraceae bacterium]
MTIFRALPAFVWLLFSALFFAYGEYLSKKWALHPGWMMALAVVGVDAIGTFLWLPAIFNRNVLSIIGMAWLLIGAVASVGIGLIVFRETLNWTQWTGMGFALIALVLLGK